MQKWEMASFFILPKRRGRRKNRKFKNVKTARPTGNMFTTTNMRNSYIF